VADQEMFIARLSALGQRSRLMIVELLLRAGEDGVSAGDIAARTQIPRPTVSIHLAVLLRAGLVRSARKKQSIFYSAEPPAIREMMAELGGLLGLGGGSLESAA